MTQNVSEKEEPVKTQEMSKKETDYPSNGKNNSNIIRKSEMFYDEGCKASQVVLKRKKNELVTHIKVFPPHGGDPYCVWGHYFTSVNEANEDFEERCRKYHVDEEKQLPEEVSNTNTMSHKNENHTHLCIDEIITGIKEQLDFIETLWEQKDIDCELIKSFRIHIHEIGLTSPVINLSNIEDFLEAIADKVEQIDVTSIRVVKQ